VGKGERWVISEYCLDDGRSIRKECVWHRLVSVGVIEPVYDIPVAFACKPEIACKPETHRAARRLDDLANSFFGKITSNLHHVVRITLTDMHQYRS